MNRLRTIIISLLILLATGYASAIPWPSHRNEVRNFNEFNGLAHHNCTSLALDRNGMLWMGTWNGLQRFDGYRFVTFRSHPGDGSDFSYNRIRGIHIIGNDIYCRAEQQCYIFNISTGKFRNSGMTWQQARKKYHFDGNVKRLLTKRGLLWTADSSGLHLKYSKPCYFVRLKSLPPTQVRCLFRDNRGRIWICTRKEHVIRIFSPTLQFIGYLTPSGTISKSRSVFGSSVYCMFQDSGGTIWMGTKGNGLFRLRAIDASRFEIKRILGNSRYPMGKEIYDVRQDRWGRLWISTMDTGLICMTNPYADNPTLVNGFWKNVLPGNELVHVRNTCLTRDGILLVCTNYGVLATRLTPSNLNSLKFTLNHREPYRTSSLSNSSAMFAVTDSRNNAYVCTEGSGINITRAGNLLSADASFMHFGDIYISSAFGYGGRVWFVGSKDIAMFDPRSNDFVCFDNNVWDDRILFTDAVPLDMGNGQWLFGLADGAAVMNLNLLTNNSLAPKIVLTEVAIENNDPLEAVTMTDTVVLNSDQRNVRLSFVAIDYKNSDNMYYRFRLDDNVWMDLGMRRSISLLGLKPGTYHVCIQARLANGEWTGNGRMITVIVKPHLWETTAAKIFYLLLILALIWFIFYSYNHIRSINAKHKAALNAYLKIANAQEEEKNVQTNRENTEFMEQVSTIIKARMGDSDFTVNDLADAMALSYSAFSRRVKDIVGITPKELITQSKMRHACRLLRTTNKTVKDIAFDCGFTDQNYFGKCFKTVMGMNPTEYRKGNVGVGGNGE